MRYQKFPFSFGNNQMEETPQTFAELYRLGCKMTDDTHFEHIDRYEDLDNLRKYIDEKDEEIKQQYLYAISSNRVCIALPYEMFQDQRRPPDSRTEDGKVLIFACPGWDIYSSNLIDQMKTASDNPNIVGWKLRILGKMYGMGWPAYVKQYIEPLKNKEEYFKSFLLNNRNYK